MATVASQSPNATLAPSSTSTANTTANDPTAFQFPPLYGFPPFFVLQPISTTRSSQLSSWSAFIQAYCQYHRLFTLTLADALSTPLFTNARLSRGLSLRDAKAVIQYMISAEGGNRAEWIPSSTAAGKARGAVEDGGSGRCWVYWKRPEEWAAALEEWVERTGQKGTVLTLYELTESDATRREAFWGMETGLLNKSLAVCVKRGKAQVFGGEGSEGVKFF
jgi:ESCRT-II complex subunit VPS25